MLIFEYRHNVLNEGRLNIKILLTSTSSAHFEFILGFLQSWQAEKIIVYTIFH